MGMKSGKEFIGLRVEAGGSVEKEVKGEEVLKWEENGVKGRV